MGNFCNELKNYQNIPRELIFDSEISDRARFVFCFMAAKDDNWTFYMTPMAKEIGYSVDTLRKYINELITRGWLIKGEQDRTKDNQFGAVSYTLKASIKTREISDTEKTRHGETPTLNNIDIERNIDNNKDNNTNNAKNKIDWRTDYQAYLALVQEAKLKMLADNNKREFFAKYYANADYDSSVNKMVEGFWGTEDGWMWNIKHRKGKTINLYTALKKNLGEHGNIVYNSKFTSKGVNQTSTKTTNKPITGVNPKVYLVDNDGTLNDGTFIRNGYRYYYSHSENKPLSIPLNAEPMPQQNNVEYDIKLGWYEC